VRFAGSGNGGFGCALGGQVAGRWLGNAVEFDALRNRFGGRFAHEPRHAGAVQSEVEAEEPMHARDGNGEHRHHHRKPLEDSHGCRVVPAGYYFAAKQ
jgi:hypothetical protein